MKVRYEQSGGWGNPLGKTCELDTEQLDHQDAETLKKLVEQSQVGRSMEARSPHARDAINYEITIEEGEQRFQVRMDDTTLPEKMMPLIDFLQSRAKPRALK